MQNYGSNIDKIASELLEKKTAPKEEQDIDYYRNDEWIRQAFMVSDLDDTDQLNRRYSTASFKYQDSSLGGNHAINPPPQWTPYCDIRHKGLMPNAVDTTLSYTAGHTGMGRAYSEALDDNKQLIHMRFGVASYNSLTQFFSGFYNSSAARFARTGRIETGFVDAFLSAVSVGVALGAMVYMPVFALTALATNIFGPAFRFFTKMPTGRFYYLKPSMRAYWVSVQQMVNQIAVNKGIVSYIAPNESETLIGEKNKVKRAYSIFSKIMPEFDENGLINVFAIANKAKRMEMRHRYALAKQLTQPGDDAWFGKVRTVMTNGGGLNTPHPDERPSVGLEGYLNAWLNEGKVASAGDKKNESLEQDVRRAKVPERKQGQSLEDYENSNQTYTPEEDEGALSKYGKMLLADVADGSEWVSFKVDYTGAVNESFSSSTSPSSMASKINSASSSARDLRVNLAQGNTGILPLDMLGGVLSGVGQVLGGAADIVGVSGIAVFAGNAFVDIPENWENSTASLPSSNYSITLTSPYGNPVSQMFNIYIPLAMILCGTLPLSTGKASFTSPFLCELYDRGRKITRLGIIDSLTITRGEGNFGFDSEGQAMSIKVNFTVKDLSTVVAMPVFQGWSLNPLKSMFDFENPFNDYMMTLAGMDLRQVNNRLDMLKYNIDRSVANIDSYFSAANWANMSANTPVGQVASIFMRGTDRR